MELFSVMESGLRPRTHPAASRSPRSNEELDLSSGKLGALDGGLDALAQRLIAAGGGSADPDAAAALATLTTFGTALHTTTPAAGAVGGGAAGGGAAAALPPPAPLSPGALATGGALARFVPGKLRVLTLVDNHLDDATALSLVRALECAAGSCALAGGTVSGAAVGDSAGGGGGGSRGVVRLAESTL